MHKVLVIGLDGGTFDILTPLMEKGRLPNLGRLISKGVSGRLRTVIPPGTGPAWSSIVTGLDPSNHGVFDLIVRARDSYNLAFLNAASLRAPTLWDLVGTAGGKSVVLNVPMTYPPRAVEGLMVSGLLTPPKSEDCAYPADLMGTILDLEPSYKIVPTQTYAPGRLGAFLDDLEHVLDVKFRIFRSLLTKVDWQFAMQVFNETDFLQHALWHVMDPLHPRHKPEESERFRERVYDFYSRIDGFIGDLNRSLPDVPIVILSDHGHGPLYRFIHANNLLLESGLMCVRRDIRSWAKYVLFRAGLTPLNVYRAGNALGLGRLRMGLRWTSKGYQMLRRFFFSFSDIDWQRSAAYAISGGVFGGVFVNLKGREPEGAVDRGSYESVRTRIGQVLLGLRDPDMGGLMVKEILKREEVYGGRFTDEAPDLFFLPRDPTIAVFGDFEFSSNRIIEPASEAISAQHRMEGIFIASGGSLRQGIEIEDISVLDVAPLLLYLMGLPIPEGLDGRLRQEVFETAELEERPPLYRDLRRVYETFRGERRSTEDEDIKQRLKGLGYIS
jgi:predicted AlkP superfamily phosphohydrolase/phosphomutase